MTNSRSQGRADQLVSHRLHRTTTAGSQSGGGIKITGPSLRWNPPLGSDGPG